MPEIYKYSSIDKTNPLMIVGILSVGEPQLPKLVSQLLDLNGNTDIYVFENFSNSLAHKKLYDLFNKRNDILRIKLDADMTIADTEKFVEVVSCMQNLDNTCQVFKVCDHFTNRDIFGVHFYSPNFNINIHNIDFGSPFVDQFGYKGVRLQDYSFINHGENFTHEQRQDFVVHRLRKALKSGDLRKGIKYFLNAFRARGSILEILSLCLDKRVFSAEAYKLCSHYVSSEDFLIPLNFVRKIDDEY